ncbi:MAG: MMPL family transporter [Chloroflexota bacterium]|nr:MMPL family transporter [Chloroflexota bacterium]
MFEAWGRFVHRRRWPVLGISAVFLVLSVVVLSQGGTLEGGGPIAKAESGRAFALTQRELPQAGGSNLLIVFSSDDLRATDTRFKAALSSALAPLAADPRIASVRTPYDGGPRADTFISRDGRAALAIAATKEEYRLAREYYPQLRDEARSDVLRVDVTGNLAITQDFNVILENDLKRAELISLPLALLLLVLVFGTVVAALLPLGVGVLAVMGGLAGVFLLSRATDVSQYALNIVTLIGLGVAIDYSLFVVNRFREELARRAPVEDAIATAMRTAGRAVTFSGLTVAIGLSGMLFYQGTFLATMGVAGAIVVALAVLYGLTFLPALLSILGPRIDRLPLPGLSRRGQGSGLWHALARWVMRRPVLVLVPVLAFIVLVGSPFLQLRLANGDVTMLPRYAESRVAYDTLLARFPNQDQTQVQVVAYFPDGHPLAPDRIAALTDLSRRIAALPEVLRIESAFDLDPALLGKSALGATDYQQLYGAPRDSLPAALREGLRQSVGEHIVVLTALTNQPAASDGARDLVRDIRALSAPPGGEILVTGQTAFDIDVVKFILDDTPAAVAWIMVATYVVLFLLLGSLVLPLKAVLMNLLSISASFGALVFIFQQGHLSEQLNFTAASIDPTLPVIMFCIVFGLSMDYEVLLLSRMQEEYVRTRDNTHSVAQGLERSGRLITGAAAIMVGVFAAFALADVVIIKAIGLGMALAVAIDATLVRALVVPATMRLLGDLNWWAPPPLARAYRRLGLGEAAGGAVVAAPVTEAH